MTKPILKFIRDLYDLNGSGKFISLHEPIISEREFELVQDCLRSTYISSVGEYVGKFEKLVAQYTGIPFAIATNNGTSALHLALYAADVKINDLVLTQALSFVATANPIKYLGADPVFIDSAQNNLGMCPDKLEEFLEKETQVNSQGERVHKSTLRRIKACVPMHVFGHPVAIERISDICKRFEIELIEDAAEALGSFHNGRHVGHHGSMSILSFNGNKIVTCGGGGMVLTSNESLAKRLKHLSTTAKVPHSWEFNHDELGFNYRLPNLNAAFACAQMERLASFVDNKRKTAQLYQDFFNSISMPFLSEPENAKSNFWLNAIFMKNSEERESFLKESNESGVMTRPLWKLLPDLPMYKNSIQTNLESARDFEQRLVNIPSSVRMPL